MIDPVAAETFRRVQGILAAGVEELRDIVRELRAEQGDQILMTRLETLAVKLDVGETVQDDMLTQRE